MNSVAQFSVCTVSKCPFRESADWLREDDTDVTQDKQGGPLVFVQWCALKASELQLRHILNGREMGIFETDTTL